MPVTAANKARYPPPAEWRKIRARILERAGDCCEECGLRNYCWVVRCPETGVVLASRPTRMEGEAARQALVLGMRRASWPVRIVLTIHHENGRPEDNRDENLFALCQRCHNRRDNPMRVRHAAETRRAKRNRGQGALELEEQNR